MLESTSVKRRRGWSGAPTIARVPISFDTAAFRQHDQTNWINPVTGDQVNSEYFGLVPDLPAGLDELPKLRHDLAVRLGADGCLIEAHQVVLDSVPALLQILKLPLPDRPGQVFLASFTVPKAGSSAVLHILCAEGAVTGGREAALMAEIGPANWILRHPYAPELTGKLPFHAGDDPRWDSRFPDHPLTRARGWAHHVVRTARIDPQFAALPPFTRGYPRAAPPSPAAQPPAGPSGGVPFPAAAPSPAAPTSPTPAAVARPVAARGSGPPSASAAESLSQNGNPTGGTAPEPQIGSKLITVVPGIPVAGLLPIWVSDSGVAYLRMPDPADVLGRLGVGALSRTSLAVGWFRESVLFDVGQSSLVFTGRYRSADGGVEATYVPVSSVSAEEADAMVTKPAVTEAFHWLGEVAVAAAARGEHIMVGPGGHTLYRSPRVLQVVADGVSTVSATPAPVDALIWREAVPADFQAGADETLHKSATATPETIRAGGILAMLAVETWTVSPLDLCVSFLPNPGA